MFSKFIAIFLSIDKIMNQQPVDFTTILKVICLKC